MFKIQVVEAKIQPEYVSFSQMKEGQIGRVVGPLLSGTIVMRVYDQVFSLSSGSSYWGKYFPLLLVEILRPGSTVTLTVTERG